MILVTTAGKVGSEAACLLAQREVPVRVLVRDPDKAKALADAGAEIAVGDLDVPASLDAAMADVTTVILVSPVLSKLLGRTITYSELSFDENKDAMIRAGVPEQIAEMNAQAFSLTADGDAEWVTSDVPSLLSRPARSFEEFATDYANSFS
jgi:hypothetical protein